MRREKGIMTPNEALRCRTTKRTREAARSWPRVIPLNETPPPARRQKQGCHWHVFHYATSFFPLLRLFQRFQVINKGGIEGVTLMRRSFPTKTTESNHRCFFSWHHYSSNGKFRNVALACAAKSCKTINNLREMLMDCTSLNIIFRCKCLSQPLSSKFDLIWLFHSVGWAVP